MSGLIPDHDRKIRAWFGNEAEVIHAWHSFNETTGYYVIRLPSDAGVKLHFARTFYIGAHDVSNIEISIDKTTVLGLKCSECGSPDPDEIHLSTCSKGGIL